MFQILDNCKKYKNKIKMKKAKKIILIGILVVLAVIIIFQKADVASAAMIQGKIYGPDLEIATKTIVQINSTPRQSLVANEGLYSFIVPQGTYEIEAFYTTQGVLLYSKETVTVPQEGAFILDLILFETPDIEDIEFDESELKLIEDLLKEKQKTNWPLIIGIIVAIVIMAAVIYVMLKSKKKHKLVRKHKKAKFRARAVKAKFEEEKPVGDEALEKTLEILKRERRVTQKDLRKELKISEAKTSLIIADLEAQGKVKKIKRGRGNILLYQE